MCCLWHDEWQKCVLSWNWASVALLESKEIETYLFQESAHRRLLVMDGARSWCWKRGRTQQIFNTKDRDNNIDLKSFAGFGFSRHLLRLHVPPRGGAAGRLGHRAEHDQQGTEGGNWGLLGCWGGVQPWSDSCQGSAICSLGWRGQSYRGGGRCHLLCNTV